jgi:hypothetical protein
MIPPAVILSEAKDLFQVAYGMTSHMDLEVGPSLAPLAQDDC